MGKRSGLLALAVLLLGVPATGPAAAAPQSSGEPTAGQQQPRWQRCAPDTPRNLECATVRVPLDYTRPDGKKIDIAISRLKASDPAKRRGVLLMNPGGPGGPGLDMPVSQQLPAEVTERYDLIGFDPRGVGRSTPVTCGFGEGGGWSPFPFDKAKFDEHVARAKEMANKCWASDPELLPFITTRNTARDMDVIRAALGEPRISYFGVSYGTYLGAVYTQLFPQRSDRIVLDSSVDPERAWRDMVRIWAPAAERAFDVFAHWAAERDGTYQLGSTPLRVHGTFRRLLNDLDRAPITVDGQRYDGNKIRMFARGIGQYEENNTYFAALLRKLRDAGARDLADVPAPRPAPPLRWQTGPPDNAGASFLGVVCGDAQWPTDIDRYRRDALRDTQRYPIMGGQTSNISPCAFWPAPREPRTEIRGNRAESVLLVQNSHDMQTPVEGAANLRGLLSGNSRMALVEGSWQHGAYPGNCADGTVTRYLVHGELPATDETCRSTQQP